MGTIHWVVIYDSKSALFVFFHDGLSLQIGFRTEPSLSEKAAKERLLDRHFDQFKQIVTIFGLHKFDVGKRLCVHAVL